MGSKKSGKQKAPPKAPAVETVKDEAKPIGRPTTFTEDLGDLICLLMAEGKSLNAICGLDGMPHKSTVLLWVVKGDRGDEQYKAFSDQYRRAREAQTEAVLDDVIEISDDDRLDVIFRKKDDESGSSAEALVNHENIARSKLRVETRFRFAAKMHPRKYGEKIQAEHTGKDGKDLPTAQTNVVIATEVLAAKSLDELSKLFTDKIKG